MTGRPARLAALLCLAALASCAGRRGGSDPARRSIVVGGAERGYLVRTPPTLGRPVPLVIVLHGGGGNGAGAERMTGFTEKGREEGFIVVYPDGSGRLRGRLLTWNSGHCCGYAMENRVDDVAFIRALVESLARDYPIDRQRIYATGMSNGAMMAHRLGIELPGTFAAIAPVVGAVFGDERRPAQRVSAIVLNGALDRSVPPEGGPSGGRFEGAWDGTPARPALDQGAFWASANGCESTPERLVSASATTHRYRCPAGVGVELHLVADNGHAWPGGERGGPLGDRPTTAFDATDVIWDFFERHPKPR